MQFKFKDFSRTFPRQVFRFAKTFLCCFVIRNTFQSLLGHQTYVEGLSANLMFAFQIHINECVEDIVAIILCFTN